MATTEQREVIKEAYYGGAFSESAFGSKVITKSVGDMVGELDDAEAFQTTTAWLQNRVDKRTATKETLLAQIQRIDEENARDQAKIAIISA